MINRVKRQVSPQEENIPISSVISPSKFQRTNYKRGLQTPEETNVTSEISEPKFQVEAEKSKPIARTTRATRQLARSPPVEQTQVSKLQRTISPPDTPKGRPKLNIDSFVREKEPLKSQQPSSSKIKTEQKAQQKSVNLKRSNAFAYIMVRLQRKAMTSGLLRLKQNKRNNHIKYDFESKCLLLSASDFIKRYELKLYTFPFERFKMILSKNLIVDYKNCNQNLKNNCEKAREHLAKVLNSVYLQKLSQPLKKIKSIKNIKDSSTRAINALFCQIQKKKLKQYFQILKTKSQVRFQMKKFLLTQVVNGYSNCSKHYLINAFRKISLFSAANSINVEEPTIVLKSPRNLIQKTPSPPPPPPPQPQDNEIVKKKEKLDAEVSKISEEIKVKEANVAQKKKQSEEEAKKIKADIEQMKNNKRKVEKQINEQKSVNQTLKKKVETAKPLTSEDFECDTQEYAQKDLLRLQKIYSQIYKMTQEQVSSNLDRILYENDIDRKATSALTEEWDLIAKKSELQRLIDLYENFILGNISTTSDQNSIVKLVREQNEMVKNLIKNFIKERYLWGEVQKFVAAVL